MATSMDPIEMATNGLDPWTDALVAIAGFVGLGISTAMALRLWHSVRFKAVGLLLTAMDVGCVAGAGVWFYREYF